MSMLYPKIGHFYKTRCTVGVRVGCVEDQASVALSNPDLIRTPLADSTIVEFMGPVNHEGLFRVKETGIEFFWRGSIEFWFTELSPLEQLATGAE